MYFCLLLIDLIAVSGFCTLAWKPISREQLSDAPCKFVNSIRIKLFHVRAVEN
jgi:hypothetical protein